MRTPRFVAPILLALLVLLALLATPVAAQQWFRAPELAPANRKYVAVADLNADGSNDILSLVGWTFEVLHGAPLGGSFTAGASFARPSDTSGYEILADVDGDGWFDLVYTYNSFSTGGVRIMPGQPGGTFSAPISIPTQENGKRLVTGDCNNDGIMDVAFIGFDGTTFQETVRWVLGDSNRQFTALPAHSVPPGADLKSIVAFDANGDGLDDVAVSSRGLTRIVLTVGNTLVAGPTIAVPGALDHWLEAIDLDSDLDEDLVAISQKGSGMILTVIENAAGTFTANSVTYGNTRPGQPFAGDWDGDGDADLFVRVFGGSFALFENTSSLQPSLAWEEHPDLPYTLLHPGLHDMNQDGNLDFVDTYAIRPGGGSMPIPQQSNSMRYLPIVDVEDDGDLDASNGMTFLRNDGRGVFTEQAITLPAPGPNLSFGGPVARADFDGDGLDEILVALISNPGPWIFIHVRMHRLEDSGNGTFLDQGPCTALGQSIAGPVFATDTNGDGVLDLAGRDGVWSNDGTHTFTLQPNSFGNYQPLEPLDINGDGDLDFLAGLNGSAQSLAILRHTGNHTFATDVIYSGGSVHGTHIPTLADVDNDGDLDVVTDASFGGGQMQLWIQQGGAFTSGPLVQINTNGSGVCMAADVDGDGATDLAYALDDLLYVMRRNGPGLTYDPAVVYVTSQARRFVDVDQDGDPDIVGRSVTFHRGFDGPSAGQRRQFGTAGVGSGNRSPVLGCSGLIRTGETPVLRLRRAVGATLTILTMGYQESSLPSPVIPGLIHYGYPFDVSLWLTTTGTPGQAGTGTHDLPITLPPGLVGVSAYFQHHVFDGGAANLIVHSNGLEFTIGG